MTQMELLDPTGKPHPKEVALATRPGRLTPDTRIGLLDNTKGNADVLLARLEGHLRDRYGVHTFVPRRKATSTLGATFLDEFAGEVQVVVNALGD